MWFQSQAESAIQNTVIKAKWDAEKERIEESANRLALYSDDYEDIIRAAIAQEFYKDNYDRLYYHVNGSQNLLKRVIDEISMVYKDEPTRTLDVESDRWEAIKDEAGLDVRMRRVNRLTNLLNETIVKVAARPDGRIAYDIITPDMCTVIQREDDPSRMGALCWQRTLVNTQGVSDVGYEYMDDLGWWVTLDKDFRIVEEFGNPARPVYRDAQGRPFMPLVVLHRQHPEYAFWDEDSGRDLYNASVSMGVKMTLMDYYFKTASFKQIYIIGDTSKLNGKMVLDPRTALAVPPGNPNDPQPEIGTLDLQPHMAGLIEALTFQLNSVINNYGISADMWTLTVGEMSGRALKIRNRALLERRAEQIPTYRQAERDLFAATRIVNNTHASFFGWERIPDEATLEPDFAEPEFPEDPIVERDVLDRDLKRGVISLGKYYQHFNPDEQDEKAAEKKAIKNLEALQALRDKHPTLDQALADIMGGSNQQQQGGAFGDDEGQGGGGGAF